MAKTRSTMAGLPNLEGGLGNADLCSSLTLQEVAFKPAAPQVLGECCRFLQQDRVCWSSYLEVFTFERNCR